MQQLTAEEKKQLTTLREAKLEILFTTRDDDGNFIMFNMGQLYMRNEGDDKNKKIGNIYYLNDTILYSKWEQTKDIYRVMDAWSAPLFIAKNVDVIWFRTPEREYWITKEKIRELLKAKEAAIMKFQGYEKKVYIPRKYWSETSVLPQKKYMMTMLAGYTPVKDRPDPTKYSHWVGHEWAELLHDFFDGDYMKSVRAKIKQARDKGVVIYPEPVNIFRAFKETPYDKVKVVILGQD